MKLRTLPRAVAALPLLLAAPAASQAPQSRCERRVAEVRQVERSWLDAYERRNRAVMERIVADGFLITHVDASAQTKADILAALAEPSRRPEPRYWAEQVRGRCYGDAVVLTGWVLDSGGGRSRYTDTYVRLRGRWRVVASHLSRPPGPGRG